jgi:uncharacterized membrane protein
MSDGRSEVVLVHFYRAVVAHMDVWRQRMDATTNWAAVTAAGMITFTFSTSSAPHYVLLIALTFQLVFLLMESRRYQTFDLWRRRFRMLNRALIVPALNGTAAPVNEEEELRALGRDLGRTLSHLSLRHAMGYRVRRNYGYLFAVTLLAWLLKLEMQPHPEGAVQALLERAAIAFVPGPAVLGIVVASTAALLGLAVVAPTGDMLDWEATPHAWQRWVRGVRGSDGEEREVERPRPGGEK